MKLTVLKHILTVFLILVFSGRAVSQVASFPYSESFEGGLNGWVVDGVSASKLHWVVGTPKFYSMGGEGTDLEFKATGTEFAQDGSWCVYVDKCSNPYGLPSSGETYISKTFDFSNLSYPILSFYMHTLFIGGDYAYLEVLVKSSDQPDYSMASKYRSDASSSSEWQKVNICLDEFAKKSSVEISFRYFASNGSFANIAVDNIKIQDFVVEAEVTNATCYDYDDGKVKLTPSGAGPIYEYYLGTEEYAPGTATYSHIFENLSAQGYDAYVVDALSGCAAYVEGNAVTITQPSEIELEIETTDIKCYQDVNGKIIITPSEITGNNAPYKYSINGGGTFVTTNTFVDLPGGEYAVVVENSKGCQTQKYEVVVGDDVFFEISDIEVTNITKCYGDRTGAITINASAKKQPLSYSIEGDKSTSYTMTKDFTELRAGTYSVYVKDANGCKLSEEVEITEPEELVIENITPVDVEGCTGDETGALIFDIEGGTAPFRFAPKEGPANYTESTITALAAGKYTPYVIDGYGCKTVYSQSVTISEPEALEIKNVEISDVSTCFGDNTGSLTINATGGTGALKYSLNFKGEETEFQTKNIFTNLHSGNYQPYVVDEKGCSFATEDVYELADAYEKLLFQSALSNSLLNLCYGDQNGQIILAYSGGKSPWSFTVEDDNNFSKTVTFSDELGTIDDLPAGNYIVSLKDDNGCPADKTYQIKITEPEELKLKSVAANDVKCYGDGSGSIEIDVEGGTLSYSYCYKQFGESGGIDSYLALGSSVISNLHKGKYLVAVKDKNNCVVYGNSEGYVIDEPEELEMFEPEVKDITTCYGATNGSMKIKVSGGVVPYKYTIGGDNDAIITTNETYALFENLPASTMYLPSVEDAHGCVVTMPLTVPLSQPTKVELNLKNYQEVRGCKGDNNGFIQLDASGGKGDYTYYLKSEPNLNGVSETNINNKTGLFDNLKAGTYTYLVTDKSGCSAGENLAAVKIIEPEEFVLEGVDVENVLCYGKHTGTAKIKVSGGQIIQASAKYKYFLDEKEDPSYNDFFEFMEPKHYTFRVVDHYNCTLTGEFDITQPAEYKITKFEKVDIVKCYGDHTGSIDIKAEGGTGTLKYYLGSIGSTEMQESETGFFDGLSAASYEAVVKDERGCTLVDDIRVDQPTQLSYLAEVTKEIPCHDEGSGELTITARGGTRPYKYSIDDGVNYNYETSEITGLEAGEYKIRVKDNNGCVRDYSVDLRIINPALLTVEAEVYDVICYEGNTGKIAASGSGGTSLLSYSLDGVVWQDRSGVFKNLSDGVYTVKVKDINGCTAETEPLTISRPENRAGFTVSQTSGCSPLKIVITQDYQGLANYEISNGDFIWDRRGPTEYTFENTSDETKKYKITSSLLFDNGIGCTDTASTYVTVFPQPQVDLRMPVDTITWPENTAYFKLMNKDLTSVHWDFGDGTTSEDIDISGHEYESCGNYNIIIDISNGICENKLEKRFVIEGRPLIAAFNSQNMEGCQPITVSLENVSLNSDSCKWDFGDGSAPVYNVAKLEHKYEAAGEFVVSLTIYGDCGVQAVTTKKVNVFVKPTADFEQNLDTLYAGQYLKVESLSGPDQSFHWDFGDGTFGEGRSVDHKYEFDGTFNISLTVLTANYCSDTTTVKNAITVISNPIVVFPTAFSPNGDGKNDVFMPIHGDIAKFKLVVLDSRGVIVFRTENINEGWDGTRNGRPCPPGMYVWKSTSTLRDKSFFQQKGHVFLIK
ncbi:MAG: gliding motility-associated C-terminal domain-containing protein [Bacteroidales bacterium]|nr:gliding motility-associated C-terminal domain-containing protein [Bacteroidales bacterium]